MRRALFVPGWKIRGLTGPSRPPAASSPAPWRNVSILASIRPATTDRRTRPRHRPRDAALLARGIAPERLVLVEYEPSFCHLLAHKFPRVKVLRGDAYRLAETLAGQFGAPSGRHRLQPAAAHQAGDRAHRSAAAGFRADGPDGRFIQFTYGVKSPIPAHGGALHFRTQALGRSGSIFRRPAFMSIGASIVRTRPSRPPT